MLLSLSLKEHVEELVDRIERAAGDVHKCNTHLDEIALLCGKLHQAGVPLQKVLDAVTEAYKAASLVKDLQSSPNTTDALSGASRKDAEL